jgi:AraC-like DNA-binding protein
LRTKIIAMKTKALAKTTLVDDGECVSFHSFPAAPGTSAVFYVGFELLVLPEGNYGFTVAGNRFDLCGPQVLLLGPGLEHGWERRGGGLSGDDAEYGHAVVSRSGDSGTGSRHSGNGSSEGGFPEGGLAIRWPADLLGEGFLAKHQTQSIAGLLEKAGYGVLFPAAVLPGVWQRLEVLRGRTGFAIYLDLLGLLHELSVSEGRALLSVLPAAREAGADDEKKTRIDDVVVLMQNNYFKPMTLEEMARKACMTKGSFCRTFRAKTGKTYSESLNEIRLGHICRMLAETTDTVSEIAYRVGYRNIHHFHRHFKRQKGCTPLEYRKGRR